MRIYDIHKILEQALPQYRSTIPSIDKNNDTHIATTYFYNTDTRIGVEVSCTTTPTTSTLVLAIHDILDDSKELSLRLPTPDNPDVINDALHQLFIAWKNMENTLQPASN